MMPKGLVWWSSVLQWIRFVSVLEKLKKKEYHREEQENDREKVVPIHALLTAHTQPIFY